MKVTCSAALIAFLFVMSFSNLVAQIFDDPDDLVDAVNASTDGGIFIVENGNYNDFEATFEVVASAGSPVIIKAESIGGVTLTGESHFVIKKSAYITLEGFVFDGQGEDSLVKLEGSNNIRITRNVFELETSESIKWVFIGGVFNDNIFPFDYPSHDNRIDHNVFQNKETPGHYITIDGSFDDTGSEEVYYQSQYDVIDYNYFKNNSPRAVNEQESIRIGWSEMSQSSGFTIVEHNLFEDCDGDPEIVSVKSCDNIIRHNTFRRSYGTLSLRHGNRNRVEGNYFFGDNKLVGVSPAGSDLYTGGIRIYGTDHLIINNYMEGLNGTRWDAPITLTLGDAIDGQSSNLSKHFRAERVTIAFNTLVNNSHGIEIGFDNNNNYSKDLEDITIANNLITGSENSLVAIVDIDNDQGEIITWESNLMYPTGNASMLSGATITSFDTGEVINENPHLEFDSSMNVWRTTATTSLYENKLIIDSINEDIEGQGRPPLSNPGADHYSLESVRYTPLTPDDVGPNAREDGITSVSIENQNSDFLVYPIPTNSILHLKNISLHAHQIELLNSNGEVILIRKIDNSTQESSIDISELNSGIYFLKVSENRNVEVIKVIVQH
ncbi:T9SS type A sorting domain-containing protein [Saprospiraceae bacterium]|nr:T9SS type A sorting domain-containing protein [Saprospiraceae bacterium]